MVRAAVAPIRRSVVVIADRGVVIAFHAEAKEGMPLRIYVHVLTCIEAPVGAWYALRDLVVVVAASSSRNVRLGIITKSCLRHLRNAIRGNDVVLAVREKRLPHIHARTVFGHCIRVIEHRSS